MIYNDFFQEELLTLFSFEKMLNFTSASSFEIVSQLEETFLSINSVLSKGDSDGKVFDLIDQ